MNSDLLEYRSCPNICRLKLALLTMLKWNSLYLRKSLMEGKSNTRIARSLASLLVIHRR